MQGGMACDGETPPLREGVVRRTQAVGTHTHRHTLLTWDFERADWQWLTGRMGRHFFCVLSKNLPVLVAQSIRRLPPPPTRRTRSRSGLALHEATGTYWGGCWDCRCAEARS